MGMRCKSAAALSTVRRTNAQKVTVRQAGWEDGREEESKPGDQPAAVGAHFRRGNGAPGPVCGPSPEKKRFPSGKRFLLCHAPPEKKTHSIGQEVGRHMNTGKQMRLSERELAGYRQWLTELEEEMEELGGLSAGLDGDLEDYFDPRSPIGRQVYASFSNEELLEPLVDTMEKGDGAPRPDRLLCVYRWYLEKRFGSLHRACWCARGRSRQRQAERRWPADWPERVDPRPFFQRCHSQGLILDEEARGAVWDYCGAVRRQGQPPCENELPDQLRTLFARTGCTWRTGLELLGIPALSKAVRRHMRCYWAGTDE